MRRISYLSIFFIVLLVPLFSLQAKNNASKDSNDTFSTYIIISYLDKNLDFIHKTVAKKISISSVHKIYKGEYFSMFPIFSNVSTISDVLYDIVVKSPSGKIISLEKGLKANSNRKNSNTVVWTKRTKQLFFDNTAEEGIYTVFVFAKDLKSGKYSSSEQTFELVKWNTVEPSPILDKKAFLDTLATYHTKPSADVLYNLFESSHAKIVNNDTINHLLFVFFREAFRSKPFLIDVLEKNFDLADNHTRLNTISLFASLAEEYRLRAKAMTLDEKLLHSKMFDMQMRMASPYDSSYFSTSFTDLLWGEFYAKGNYAPIECIMKSFSTSNLKSAENFVKNVKESKSVKSMDSENLRSSIMLISAAYSLMHNSSAKIAMSYVDYYCEKEKASSRVRKAFGLVQEYLKVNKKNK